MPKPIRDGRTKARRPSSRVDPLLTLAQSVPLTKTEAAAVAMFLFGVVVVIGGILLIRVPPAVSEFTR